MLIAFTGCKGAGKDTAAQWLVESYDFTRMAFADKVKEAIANLFGITVEQVDQFKEIGIDDIALYEVNLFMRNVAEWTFSWREFMQRFGTEMGRGTFGEDFWILQLERAYTELQYSSPQEIDVAITDLRFENEAQWLRRMGGFAVEIIRPGYEPDGHLSEEPLPRGLIETQILNNGSIDDLHVDVYELYKGLQRV